MSFGDTIQNEVLGTKPTTPVDTDGTANAIAEGAAVNTTVGITAHSTFANGNNDNVDYSLTADSSGGGFKIDQSSGVVTVADPSKIDFESAPGHVYTISVRAAKNGNFSSDQVFTISVNDIAPSTPVDSNPAANTVLEGAATGTSTGITASSSDINGGTVTWSLGGDTSGGGFAIDATTGVITVADGSKIDFESAPSHVYSVTAVASDGTLTSSQAFTINVGDVAMSTPVDTNGAANSVAEGAAAGTTVGITAQASDPSGPATTYSLIGDTSGGGFTINSSTGVVTVANPAKIDFESSAPGHTYSITVQASTGAQTTSQAFTIGVTDVAPSAPVDGNGAANSVAEGAAVGTVVGVTASSSDVNGPAPTYSLIADSSGGGFTINSTTGVITVANSAKIDYETAAGHAYSVTVQASDGTLASSQSFSIGVTDVAPSTPTDVNGATNTVAEGAAVGTAVGITASSSDINGPAVTWSLTGDSSAGGFAINSSTGVITVANSGKIDYETAAGHAYSVTATASDGTLSSSQSFSIAVTDVAPSTPTDTNPATNSIAEGAANGSTVGVTASSTDPNGPAASYTLTDNAGGRFAINSSTGVVTVANGAAIDFETAPGAGHSYSITVQGTSGALSSTQTFSIGVTDVAPSTPVDSNGAANSVFEGAANGTAVGITASSADPGGGPAPSFTLTDSAGGRFAINSSTGVVTVANGAAIDFETAPGAGHSYGITVQATAGALSSTQNFSIAVGNVNEAPAGADKTVTIAEDNAYTFAVADFGFSDPGDSSAPNSLQAVKMTTVPGAGTGTFTNNGVTVNAGDFVSATDISAGHLVFTPALNANGSPEASFTFQVQDNGGTANGGVDLDQSPNTLTINVTAVNDAPVNSVPGTQSVNEDATLTFSSGNGNAITISDVDVGAGNETVTLTVTSGTLALGSTAGLASFTNNAASITLTGTVANVNAAMNGLTYHGNLNFNGADTLVVSTNDNGNTGSGGAKIDTDNVTINVTSVNDAPVGTDKTVTMLEGDSYVFSVADFGFSDPNDNPAPNSLLAVKMTTVPGAGTGTFTNNGVTVNAGDFVSATDISAGHLVFTPTAHSTGAPEATFTFQVQDNGGTANGGVDLDQSANNVAINVNAVNDAPVNSVPLAAQNLNEEGTLTFSSGNGNAITISDVDVGSGNETVTLTVTGGTLALGSTAGLVSFTNNAASITLTGTIANVNAAMNGLTYTGNLNFNGVDTLVVGTNDNGNTGAGGPKTDSDNVTINVAAVNDAPVNGVSGTQTVNEDTALVFSTANSNAISISDVDANGGNETVTLSVASGALTLNGTAGLAFGVGDGTADTTMTFSGTVGAINAALNGMSYQGNLNFNGSDTLNINTNDNGNTGSGGAKSDADAVTINVTAVNDAPTFTVGGNQTVAEDSGAHTVNGFIATFSAGPANEAGQTVDFLTGNDNNALFSAQPTIDGSGNLSYTLAANANGSATVTVQAHDNGGTANGGSDTSAQQTFTITATPVNDAPSGANATLTTLEDTSYTFSAADFGFSDPVDAANASGANNFQSVVITTVPGAAGTLTDNGVTLIAGNTVTKAHIDGGLLKFNPTANANGSPEASFTFQVKDDGGTGGGNIDTDPTPNTITFNVTPVNDAPSGADKTVGTVGNYTFQVADFGFTDPNDSPANAFLAVKIATAPATGTLTNNGIPVNAGDFVPVTDIAAGHLVFTPTGGANDSFTFQVQDNGGVANSGVDLDQSANTLTIAQDIAPVIDAPANADTATVSAAENQTAVTTVHATDPDGPSPVSYSIVGGEDAGKFSIVASGAGAGTLTFQNAPDFENPTDGPTSGSNSYIVTVRASDGVAFDEQTITVNVTNVNEAPTANPDTASVTEAGGVANGTAGTDITTGFNVITGTGAGSVADTDPEGGALTISEVNGSNANIGVGIHNASNFGTLTLSSGGGYTYAVNQSNATVQGLRQFSDTLTDQFTYKVSDGTNTSNLTTLTVTIHGQDDNPVANADSVTVAEKGGVNNATGGTDITGFTFNAITGAGTGNVADTDVDSAALGETLRVVGVLDGNHLADPNSVTGNIGAGVSDNNNYGALTFQNTFANGTGDGSYNFVVNQANSNFLLAGEHLDLVYTYKVQDTAGATSVALLNVRINGADDLAQANADTGSMGEDASATIFPVENNDVTDPDHDALNTISIGAVTVSNTPAGTTFANTDATATLANSSTAVQVALGAAFQQLHAGETAQINVPYTLTGSPGQTSSSTLTVTVNGANDVPVAVDDTGSMTEDQSGIFSVLTGAGADTLDPDHGAPNNVTTGAVTNLVAPAGENIDVGDITVGVNGSNQITVSLGIDFQHMKDGETTTFDVPYTLHGDQPGDTANATLHVTVTGANDNPVAQNFTFNGVNSATANTDLVLDDGVAPAPTDPAGPQKTITGSLLTGALDVDGPQPLSVVAQNNALTSQGGHVTVTTTGEFIYKPLPGFSNGTDTFTYTVTDGNTPTAGTDTKTVTINVIAPKVWYVDATNGSDATGDGTSEHPFQTLASLNGAGGAGDVDSAGDTIFLYNGTYTTASGFQLENNETLVSQSQGLIVPDGGGGAGTVTLVSASGANATVAGGIILASGNTINGIDATTTSSSQTGLKDSGGTVGTLTVSNSNVSGSGAAIDITHGGTLAVTLGTVSSSGGTDGIALGGALTGSFTGTAGTLSGHSGSEVHITGGASTISYGGTIGDGTGNSASITGLTGGSVALSGNINDGVDGGGGIGISGNANATITFSGATKTLNTVTGDAVSIAGSTGTTNVNFTGGGLDIDTTNGSGFIAAGGAVSVTGSGNSITTTGTGGIVNMNGVSLGASGVTFGSLQSTGASVNNTAVLLNDVDGNTFTSGGTSIAGTTGAGNDGIRISGGSSSTFNFNGGTTVSNTANDGINLSGANGAVTFGSVALNGMGGDGIDIGGNTNGVTVSGGTIGNSNDPAGAGVKVGNGGGDVSVAASITKTTAGNVVDVTGHTGGTLAFSGAISGTGAVDNGISLTNNTGGTITFSNATTTLNTGANNAVDFTNTAATGAAVTFSGGNLNIDTTGGKGINATSSVTGAGSLTVTGANNSIASGSGTALTVDHVNIGASNVTFHDISANGAASGIILNTTGSSGHLAVTGGGSVAQGGDFSGGIIQNTTGAGISLTSTTGVTLNNMKIQTTVGDGVDGTGVHSFTFTNGTIDKSGLSNALAVTGTSNTSNIGFNSNQAGSTNNIDGTVTITNNILNEALYHGVQIFNRAGTLSDVNISNNSLTSTTSVSTSLGQGIHVVSFGDASGVANVTKAEINNNSIHNFPVGVGLEFQAGNSSTSGPGGTAGTPGSGTNIIQIDSNTIAGQDSTHRIGSEGMVISITGGNAGSRGNANFEVNSNNISNVGGFAIGLSTFGDATSTATVNSNIINANQPANSGSGGLGIGTSRTINGSDTPNMKVTINANNIQHTDGNGILVLARDATGSVEAKVTNNTVGVPNGEFEEGIRVDSGNINSVNETMKVLLTGNTTTGSFSPSFGLTAPGIGVRKEGTVANVNTFGIVGLSPSPATAAQTEVYIGSQNPNSSLGSAGASHTGNSERADVISGSNFVSATLSFLTAADGGVKSSTASPGEMHLTQAQLDSVVAAAIDNWAAAGASAAQLALLHTVTFSVTNVAAGGLTPANALSVESKGHVDIDDDAAGHGWFVDPTPNSNSEFSHAANAAGTDLFADAASAAAGHIDLLTAVTHELGHVLGLQDVGSPADDLMYLDLVDGERRIPDAADVANANTPDALQAEAALPLSARAATGTPVIAGTAGNDIIDAGHGGNILFGGAGADKFVFGSATPLDAPTPAQVTHVADYHAAEGDTFDFSAITSTFHNSSVSDALVVRAVEDASGKFATLQVDHIDPMGLPSAPNWVNIAQLDGAHAGDAVNVLIDNHSVHLAQIHVDLLV